MRIPGLLKLDLYLLRKFLTTLLFMVVLLVVVVVVIDFAEKQDDFIKNDVPVADAIFWYYLNLVPWLVNLLAPICVFLSAIFFTAKLTQHSEFIAMLSGGISFYRLMVPYLIAGGLFVGVSFYLNLYVVPSSLNERLDFEYHYFEIRNDNQIRNIHKKIGSTDYAYMYRYDNWTQRAYLFSLQRFDSTGSRLEQELNAAFADYIDSLDIWRMHNVLIRQIKPDGKLAFVRHAQLDTTLLLSHEDVFQRKQFAASLTMPRLNRFIALERSRGSDILKDLILEKYTRFALPFAGLVLTVIAFALSTRKRRGGIALQLGLGFIICFVFVFFLQVSRVALNDLLPLWLAVWLPNIVFGVFGLVLLRLAPK